MTFKLRAIVGLLLLIVSYVLIITATLPIKGLKDTYYLIFIHPPFAWTAYIFYIIAVIQAVRFLRVGEAAHRFKAAAAMNVGYLFIIFAAFSGMAWGQVYWGDVGVARMDPRFTSIIFALILYSAYFVLRQSIADTEKKARISMIYAVFCAPFLTFFIFVMPRLKYSLHPENPILNQTPDGGFSFGLENIIVLLLALTAVLWIANIIYRLRTRLETIESHIEAEH